MRHFNKVVVIIMIIIIIIIIITIIIIIIIIIILWMCFFRHTNLKNKTIYHQEQEDWS